MNIGTGTSITFGSGFLAEILDVTPPNASRKSIEVSHMGTEQWHEFKPAKLVDWGELKCDIGFNPGAEPPFFDGDGDPLVETVTITFPDGETWAFSGFMTGYEPKDPLEDRMTASVTIKVTGEITITGITP